VVLMRLIPTATSSIVAVTGTNAMIITDRASNVARIKKIIDELDKAGSGDVEMIPLTNSDAAAVVRTLTTFLTSNPADAASGTAPKAVADERTNSVLVTGDAGARARVRTYIENLDRAVADSNNTETRRLKYANVDDVVTTLKAQQSGTTAATGGGGATPAAAAAAGPAAERNVTILGYKQTNTLIITAPQKTRRALMAIVDALDIERTQVLIEAVIADVTMDKSNDLGVNWGLFSQKDGQVVPGAMFDAPTGGQGTDIVSIAKAIDDPSSAQVIPGGLTAGFAKIIDGGLSWAMMLRAIATDANTNVVASPRQVTLDNQEVNLESGQNVPFLSGSYTSLGNAGAGGGAAGGGGGIGNPFTTVNRQDIGTKLKITPQLNGTDAMTLTIDLESSELAGQTGDAGSQITNKRTFHNVILVKDQQMIMIGGLMREGETTSETRVPFLGRIPLLGNLFKTRNAVRSKKNLMVFIRATIIRNDQQLAQITSETYEAVRAAQQEQKKEKQAPPMLPGQTSPLLPPLPATSPAPKTSPVP
jgi:general secretion pathway protein D